MSGCEFCNFENEEYNTILEVFGDGESVPKKVSAELSIQGLVDDDCKIIGWEMVELLNCQNEVWGKRLKINYCPMCGRKLSE